MPVSAFLCSLFHTRTACGNYVQYHLIYVQTISWIDWTPWLAGGGKLWKSRCEISAEGTPNMGSMTTIIFQISAARQGFKQLHIRLTMAVSAVSVWFPAACNPWLRWWPLSKLAHLSASLLVLQGEACSFSALCRRSSIFAQTAEASVLPWATLAAALASEHCCGSTQGCHQAS